MSSLSERMAFVAGAGVSVGDGTVRAWASEADELEQRIKSNERTHAAVAMENDRLRAQVANRDATIDRLKRITVENENVVALNKRVAALTTENNALRNRVANLIDDRDKLHVRTTYLSTTYDELRKEVEALKGQNASLNEALLGTQEVVTENDRLRETENDRLREIAKLGEHVKHQLRIIDDLRNDLGKALKKQSDETERADYAAHKLAAAQVEIGKLSDELAHVRNEHNLRREEIAKLEHRNDNQSHIIKGLREELGRLQQGCPMVPKTQYDSLKVMHANQKQTIERCHRQIDELAAQLEVERTKVGPVQDLYRDAKLEVRLLSNGVVQVLEYGGGSRPRLRTTRTLVDWRVKSDSIQEKAPVPMPKTWTLHLGYENGVSIDLTSRLDS